MLPRQGVSFAPRLGDMVRKGCGTSQAPYPTEGLICSAIGGIDWKGFGRSEPLPYAAVPRALNDRGAVYGSLFNFQIVFLVEIATSAALPPPRNDDHLPLLADLGQALEREQEAHDCRQRAAGEHHQPVDLVDERRLGTDDRKRALGEGLYRADACRDPPFLGKYTVHIIIPFCRSILIVGGFVDMLVESGDRLGHPAVTALLMQSVQTGAQGVDDKGILFFHLIKLPLLFIQLSLERVNATEQFCVELIAADDDAEDHRYGADQLSGFDNVDLHPAPPLGQ